MRILVVASPNAKRNSVTQMDDGTYYVKVDAPAREGKANARLIEILAAHFGVAKSGLRITRGLRGRKKELEIPSSSV